jgi:hypothetical protein
MIALAVLGTYLMVGSLIALLAWSKRDQDEWLANHPLINGLTFLWLTVFWPRIFVIFVQVLRRKLKDRRSAQIVEIPIEGTQFVLRAKKPIGRQE